MIDNSIDTQNNDNNNRISCCSAVSAFFFIETYIIIDMVVLHKIEEIEPYCTRNACKLHRDSWYFTSHIDRNKPNDRIASDICR